MLIVIDNRFLLNLNLIICIELRILGLLEDIKKYGNIGMD